MKRLQSKISVLPKDTGFSLVETLVAISVLLSAITGVMVLVNQSIESSDQLKNRLSASYLASDAIEYLRHSRDSYWLKNTGNDFKGWISDANLDNCLKSMSKTCQVDTRVDVTGQPIQECSSCDPLQYNSNSIRYGHLNTSGPNWEDSQFTRTIQIEESDVENPDDGTIEEVIITAKVEWENRAGNTTDLILKDALTAWGD